MSFVNLSTGQGREFQNQYLTPHKMDRERVYRISIYSKDGLNGATSFQDNIYQIVLDDIPEPNKYHIMVESWAMKASVTLNSTTPFIVELSDISQPDSYSTSTKTNSRIALIAQTSTSWGGIQNNISTNTVGIPLSDTNIMRNKQLRIQVKGLDDSTTTAATNLGSNTTWIMNLVIYPFKP
jgi:hypothetical protein